MGNYKQYSRVYIARTAVVRDVKENVMKSHGNDNGNMYETDREVLKMVLNPK